ncbi:MAG TPA: PAS domain S-box protein [Actinomycetota bacterium]
MSLINVHQDLIERAPDAIVLVDAGGVIKLVNSQTEILFGYGRDELVGSRVEALVPEHLARRHAELRAAYAAHPETRPMGAGLALFARRKDGSEFPVDISLAPVRTENGVLVSAFIHDVTERTLAERARALLAAIVSSCQDAIIGVDADGRVASWNPAAETLYGYRAEEALGRTVQELLVPPDDVPEHEQKFARAAAGEHVSVHEAVRFTKASRAVSVSIAISPVRNSRGEIIGVASIHRDITERKRAEKERELLKQQQSQRLESLGQLAGGVAHDFNNLLAAILNYAELILDEPENVESVRDDVGEIVRAAQRAAALVHQLLVFGRREIVKPEVLDLNDIVRELEQLFRHTIGEHIELRAALAHGLMPVKIDPSGVEQVCMNLVVNARDAMPGGGALTIETRNVEISEDFEDLSVNLRAGRYVRLSVSDSGSGMPPEVLARVFEPFYTTKPQGVGTGLGLATVYGIVTQAGGGVHIYSEPGVGTAVRVYLPVTDEAAGVSSQGQAPSEQIAGAGETIVVVEDEDLVREPTVRVLSRRGYAVLAARNGAEALEVIRTHDGPVDLLITDVVMPQMSGVELAAHLHELHPGTPVLFTSGYPQDLLERGQVLSGRPLLEKPYSTGDLLGRVRSMLDSGGGGEPVMQ